MTDEQANYARLQERLDAVSRRVDDNKAEMSREIKEVRDEVKGVKGLMTWGAMAVIGTIITQAMKFLAGGGQ